ncbi:MAG: MBL fold metallo-hydrolase [Aliishimia sp.]
MDKILAAHDINTDQVPLPCNLMLLRFDDKVVLFDAGSGAGFMPNAGRKLESLESLESLETLGLSADNITHVIFTHAHPDHLWGILDDFDDPVFPQAELMIGQMEWDYWTNPNTVSTIGEERASFAVDAARRLNAVQVKRGSKSDHFDQARPRNSKRRHEPRHPRPHVVRNSRGDQVPFLWAAM